MKSAVVIAIGLAASASGWCQQAKLEAKAPAAVAPTYPIAEPDLLDEIHRKLKAMEASGEMAKKIDEAKKRSIHSAQYPKPVTGLGRSAVRKTYYFDPSIQANKDIKDAEGKLIVAAGQKMNPLDYTSMSDWLVFFDGSDERQVKAAEELGKRYGWMVKPILVRGGPIEIMRRWKRQVYFDQGGFLVRKLGIQNVPALVTQEGKQLRIDELTY
jgi:conjugal transfer pilus assembly protein TraW